MTTSQQPAAGDPAPGSPGGSGPEGGARSGRGRTGGRAGLVAVLAVVLVLLLAVVWLFAAGPLSSSARAERAVEQTLRQMSEAGSFAEFNDHLCAENRVPQELVDSISDSGAQTGTDLDALFLQSIAGSFPKDLRVTGVEVGDDGSEATATVESDSEGAGTEQVRMRNEDGTWKVCEPGVGMGAVPQGDQPG